MAHTSSLDRTEHWRDLIAACEFARDRFDQWGRDGKLDERIARQLSETYSRRRDELADRADRGLAPPDDLDLPSTEYAGAGSDPAARAYKFWSFLNAELQKQDQAGTLPLADAHACQAEANERMNFLRRRLERFRVPAGTSPLDVYHAAPAPERPAAVESEPPRPKPRRPLIEIILDPRSIQWFLAFGGGLFVFGLVLYLYTKRVFDNPVVMAVSLGLANAAFLFGGWTLIRKTRYQMAGRALTLLACLVMPLNLWFYHAQDLITLQGRLWLAGVVVCALYAASAWVLREWMFVPVFMGGVAMTGLLLLASLDKFWEIAAPSTFLVVLGLIGIHVERAFADDDSPFGRKKFGLAFFFSGHALMAAGLLLVLGAQLSGNWLLPFFEATYHRLGLAPSEIAKESILALVLVLAGVYANLYSDLVVRHKGIYVYLAAFCLLWAEVLILDLLHITVGVEVLLGTLALTALVANIVHATSSPDAATRRAFPALGLSLALVPVVFGVILHFRATNTFLSRWSYETSWAFVAAMAATIISCRFGAHIYRERAPRLSAIYFFATAAAEMIGAAAILRLLDLKLWQDQAWILMLIPIAHAVAAWLYRGRPWAAPVLAAGHAATIVMLASSLLATLKNRYVLVSGEWLNLQLAAFFLLAALFYLLTATLHAQRGGVYMATIAFSAAVWQVLRFYTVGDEIYALAFAAMGMILLVAYRFGAPETSRFGRSKATFECANGLLSAAFIASVFQSLQRLAMHEVRWQYVAVCIGMTLCAFVAAGLVRHSGWRRWYVLMTIGQGLLTVLAVQALTHLTPWQKAELFSVLAGAVLLVMGHAGWRREQERESDMVSFCLGLGSLLVGVPLTIAVLYHRATPLFSWPDELGLLIGGLVLLATGFVLELKATTLTGASMVTVYVVTLVLFARHMLERVQTAALMMAIGGGLIFGIGLILAVWRDRLLALPMKVRERRGVFRVLNWR